MMLLYKYQDSRPCGFRQEFLFMFFPYKPMRKTCDPRGGAIFDPRGIILTNLVKVYQMMLHTKYQGSKPCGFRQDVFFHVFPIQAYVKYLTPRRDLFWHQGYNLNNLGRGLLGDATYQISMFLAFWFQTRRFLMFSSRKSILSLCDLDMQWTRTI